MAYDPYSTEQYGYQDPYAAYDQYGYGDSDFYGYGGYDNINSDTPPPSADKNWEDPVKVVRNYLKKIQKDCVREEFKGLKDEHLFSVQILIESINVKKEIAEEKVSKDKAQESFVIFVKLFDFSFMKVDEIKTSGSDNNLNSVLSYSDLFQTMYTATEAQRSLEAKLEENEDQTEDQESIRSSFDKEKKISTDTEATNDTVAFEIGKGKTVMIPTLGITMIQNLQQHSIVIKVSYTDALEENNEMEAEVLGILTLRFPENFHKTVLWSIKPDIALPYSVVEVDKYKLMDLYGQKVGEVTLSLTLTCFGKAVAHCVREMEDGHYGYEHTMVLKSLKLKHIDESNLFTVDPKLAMYVMEMGLPTPLSKTSTEILEDCLNTIEKSDEVEEIKYALKSSGCDWLRMVKKSLPKESVVSVDSELMERQETKRILSLWRKHKQICRELKSKEDENAKKSLFERLEEVQIQTGLAELEVENPFEKLAQSSPKESLTSSKKSKSSGGSRQKSSIKSKSS